MKWSKNLLMNMKIIGTGSEIAKGTITNDDISKLVETSDEWIRERTGIEKRHVSLGETVADLGTAAAVKALEDSGVKAEELDMIIVASCSSELALPCVACQIQDRIGAKNAVCFDLNAACAGFLFALNTAYMYISGGAVKKALLVGSEVLSKIMDWEDRNTCILFGDGAGAAVVEATEEDKTFSFAQNANGSKGNVLACRNRNINNPLYKEEETGKYVEMDGPEVFKFAVGQVPVSINEVLEKAGASTADVDYYILHQANLRIITSIAKRLKEDMAKFPVNVNRVGNTSSASIPILLDECNKNGILKRGMKLVLSGFGAGLTYGATYLEW